MGNAEMAKIGREQMADDAKGTRGPALGCLDLVQIEHTDFCKLHKMLTSSQ